MYRLGGLHLYDSSKTVISINTLPYTKRYKVVKPIAQREHLDPDCCDEYALFESSIIDFYRARPVALDSMSLYEFASWYTKDNGITRPASVLPRVRLLQPYSNTVFRKRKSFVIIKPSKIRQTSDDYYYSCLLLYYPHRSEFDLIIPYVTYRNSYLAHFPDFDQSYKRVRSLTEELEEAIRRVHLVNLQSNIFNDTSATHQTTGDSEYCILQRPDTEDCHNLYAMTGHPQLNHSDDLAWHTLTACTISEDTLENRISTLSDDQKSFFSCHYMNLNQSEKLHLYCTGGAGTGKSFLLQTIVEWLRLCHSAQPETECVIVCAPTGVAARNVKGYTLHNIFKLPVQHGYEPDFHELPSYTLKKLRQLFFNVHTVIIDEISMVSTKYLHYIHQRLCSIANTDSPFGNYNIILFGDFYQLRHVRGRYVFTDTILWPLFKPYILKTNKRQQGDEMLVHLLNRLRIGEVTAQNVSLLQSRMIPDRSDSSKHLLHIFPTNKQVMEHNRY